jgi:hypothetical protein
MAPAGTTVAIKPRACTVNAAVLVAPTAACERRLGGATTKPRQSPDKCATFLFGDTKLEGALKRRQVSNIHHLDKSALEAD